MRHAETVTFGGSALDRAAHLRGQTDQAKLLCDEAASVMAVWRGKPLITGQGDLSICWLPLDHPFLEDAAPLTFLGLDEAGPRFARDMSSWEPAQQAETLGAFLDLSEQTSDDLPDGSRFAELRMIMTHLSARDAELAATARGVFEWHRTHSFCAKCGAKSTLTQGGWQRDCPACGRHHFPRTDPVAIMLITDGNACLLGRSPGWPEGMYSCLAGFIEPGESVEAAVRREVFEEAGVKVGDVTYLASQPWPFPGSLMIGCHGHAVSRDITIDPAEIEDARWFTREEVMEAFGGRHPVLLPARKGAIAHFLLSNWISDRLY